MVISRESSSRFDVEKANRAVSFINLLKHTKGIWHGVPFELLPWQDTIIRDIFGTVKPNGYRQYNTVFTEIAKKQGKSELAAAVALYLTCGDSEWGAEVYGCASDRQQASIVFDVAVEMVEQCPALKKRIKPLLSQKRLIYKPLNSFYQVLSAEAYCLAPDTLLDLADGSRRKAKEIAAGDTVLGWDGSKLAFGRVKSVKAQPPAAIYRITTCRGREIEVTALHQFLTMTRGREQTHRFHWVKAKDLAVNDRLMVALGWPEKADNPDVEEAWALGGARTKRIPEIIFRGGPNHWAAFLAGFLDTDGYVPTKTPCAVWCSSSRELLTGCQALLARLGINASLNKNKLSVSGIRQLKELNNLVGRYMSHPRKRELLAMKAGIKAQLNINNHSTDRIAAITVKEPAATVSLEVDGTATHVTNGIITHNSKHGLNVHGVVFDELHAQPNRELYDVMTKGSGDARMQPMFFLITTAGTDRNSICWEIHQKAMDILKGRKVDPTFYPVVYGIEDDDDWTDERNWYKANPSLGITVSIDKMRDAFNSAKDNPAEENLFRQLRLNQWVKQSVRWMPMDRWDKCSFPVNPERLHGRMCYGGLDLSSTTDITALLLVFPPEDEDDKYHVIPYFWIPDENLRLRVRRDHVPYDVWKQQGYLRTTEGNVVHYGFIEAFIEDLSKKYRLKEVAFDRWGAVQMAQNLEGMGLTVVPFGQGFKDMSPPTKELMKLTLEGKIAHGGHPVLRWMMDNIHVKTDPAGNIKPDKEKSTERIDGAVALIMALDRSLRHQTHQSIYEEREVRVL